MDVPTRQFVRLRAKGLCEYCLLPESADPFRTFHLDHVIARQHGGSDEAENLCWSCSRCNLRKGTNLVSIDDQTGNQAPLFNPRHDVWSEHFAWNRFSIVGLTPKGRATVRLLDMNAQHRIRLRAELRGEGNFDAT